MLIIWVIGMPLIALFILIKKRNSLDDWSIKKYLLILYQGLKPKVFYWEFINTFRKVVILLINVVLVSYSSSYRVLIAICFLVIILKVQERLKPYKIEENNRIEMIAIMAAFITFYCAIIFVSQDSSPPGFNEFAVFLMFFINAYFIVHWTFLLLCSIGWNNEKYQLFLSIFSLLICKKKAFFADQVSMKKSSEQSKDEISTKIKKSSDTKKHKKFKKMHKKKMSFTKRKSKHPRISEEVKQVFELMDDQTVKSSDSFDILYLNKGQIIQTPKEQLNAFK